MILKELIEKIDKNDLEFHTSSNINLDKEITNAAVLFSHELSYTGAPIVLMGMAKTLITLNYEVIIVCDKYGDLCEELVKKNISVIIYPNYENDLEWLDYCSQIFDFVLANTLICYSVVKSFSAVTENKIHWWIHENEMIFDLLSDDYKGIANRCNVRVLSAGPYVQNMVRKYMNTSSDILNFYIDDENVSIDEKKEIITFLNIGTIDGLKGQDILVDAIEILPKEIIDKTKFIFIGRAVETQIEFLKRFQTVLEKYPNIQIYKSLPRKNIMELYNEVDSVIVASKIEPTSAIMVEGLMKGKVGICSDVCGICNYLENNENALIFKSEDAIELSKTISFVVRNYGNLTELRKNGRKVYEKIFSEQIFIENLKRYINQDD